MHRNTLLPASFQAVIPDADRRTVSVPGAGGRRRRGLCAAALFTVAAALGGCAADTAAGPAEAGADAYDIYLAEEVDTIEFGQDVLRFHCLVDNGYTEFEAFVPESPTERARQDADQITTDDSFFASEQDAKSRGLREEPAGPAPAKVYTHDSSFGTISDACDATAWDALGSDARQLHLEYRQLGNAFGALGTSLSEDLVRLQHTVAQCLVDAGEPVTAAQDQLFGIRPDIELGQPVVYPERIGPKQTQGVEIIPADAEIAYVPTPAESDLAVKYYECSRQTGAREEFEHLLSEAKTEIVAEHEAELSELNPKIQELARKAADLSGR